MARSSHWYQPQICTSTGRISGVEALARWIHPERGIVPPAQFLRVLAESGKMQQLSEVILQHALTALRSWDRGGSGRAPRQRQFRRCRAARPQAGAAHPVGA
ncbi:EAL domain-containing protein [Ponticoccus litoralis]|uniref:EAL domain-containing protein n=1 Tax=Ponticoccus litoralis TaxID=422297 RepID=A0AAW9SPT5_9RHOB